MANYRARAINLKSYNLGESDKIMVMYSREYGILRCVAKGVKKPSASLGGRMQLLIANNLLLAKGKNLDIVCQAEVTESFSKITKDMTKLIYAFYCAELVSCFGLENDHNSKEIYDILFEALKNISMFSTTEEILWTVIGFKLKLMQQLGYAPELDNCSVCNCITSGLNAAELFCPDSGGIVCERCAEKIYKCKELNKEQIKIFRDTQIYDFPEDEKFLDKELLYPCFNILKEYVTLRSDKKFKTPEMIETLCC